MSTFWYGGTSAWTLGPYNWEYCLVFVISHMYDNPFTAGILHHSYNGRRYWRNDNVSDIWFDRNSKQDRYLMRSSLSFQWGGAKSPEQCSRQIRDSQNRRQTIEEIDCDSGTRKRSCGDSVKPPIHCLTPTELITRAFR
jgi:hypothetical protein